MSDSVYPQGYDDIGADAVSQRAGNRVGAAIENMQQVMGLEGSYAWDGGGVGWPTTDGTGPGHLEAETAEDDTVGYNLTDRGSGGIQLDVSLGTGTIRLLGLPTSDPSVAGALYTTAGALMVSAGLIAVGSAKRAHLEGRCDPQTCYSCRVMSVCISGSALPTRAPEVGKQKARVKQLHRDRTAFKSMTNDGLAPARLHGAEELARKAESKWEVESGHILPASIRSRALEAHAEIAKGNVPSL